jgi:uncharacterized protein (TIGR02996 family)
MTRSLRADERPAGWLEESLPFARAVVADDDDQTAPLVAADWVDESSLPDELKSMFRREAEKPRSESATGNMLSILGGRLRCPVCAPPLAKLKPSYQCSMCFGERWVPKPPEWSFPAEVLAPPRPGFQIRNFLGCVIGFVVHDAYLPINYTLQHLACPPAYIIEQVIGNVEVTVESTDAMRLTVSSGGPVLPADRPLSRHLPVGVWLTSAFIATLEGHLIGRIIAPMLEGIGGPLVRCSFPAFSEGPWADVCRRYAQPDYMADD